MAYIALVDLMYLSNVRIGVDFGNVIIDHKGFGTNTEYIEQGDFNRIPPVAGSVQALASLLRQDVACIAVTYNATDVVDSKIIDWLRHWLPSELLNDERLIISRSLNGRDKRLNCQLHQLTHFIDDRVEVLNGLMGVVPNRILLNYTVSEFDQFFDSLKKPKIASSWEGAIRMLEQESYF
jgi:hypothetical protein